jgi:Phosphoenolpyruvate phosphomutase
MTDLKHKAEQFRALRVPGRPFVVFNVWDAGSARAVVAGGAKAVATSSWSVANANGFPDGERIPVDLAIDNLRRIVRVTDLPLTIDLESGYGEAPEAAGETVRLAMDAGAVGCNLKDSFRPLGDFGRLSISAIAFGVPGKRPIQRRFPSSSTLEPTSFSRNQPNNTIRRWLRWQSNGRAHMRTPERMGFSRPVWRTSVSSRDSQKRRHSRSTSWLAIPLQP